MLNISSKLNEEVTKMISVNMRLLLEALSVRYDFEVEDAIRYVNLNLKIDILVFWAKKKKLSPP